MTDKLNKTEIIDYLKDLIFEEQQDDLDAELDIDGIEDIQDAGYLTNDKGIVITLPNRQKFMITVKEVN